MIENQIKKYPYLGIELIQNFIIIGLKQLGNNFFAKVSIDLYNHIQYVTVSLDVMYQKSSYQASRTEFGVPGSLL